MLKITDLCVFFYTLLLWRKKITDLCERDACLQIYVFHCRTFQKNVQYLQIYVSLFSCVQLQFLKVSNFSKFKYWGKQICHNTFYTRSLRGKFFTCWLSTIRLNRAQISLSGKPNSLFSTSHMLLPPNKYASFDIGFTGYPLIFTIFIINFNKLEYFGALVASLRGGYC